MRLLRYLAVSCLFLGFLLIPSANSRAQGVTIVVTNADDSGAGSFRQAILDANSNTGKDVIRFNTPGYPTIKPTIQLLTPLPNLTDPDGTTIDAIPAGDPNCTDRIVISGQASRVSYGLKLEAGNNILQGLNFQYFQDIGMQINATSSSNALYCNTFENNLAIGLRIEGTYNTIGENLPPLPNRFLNTAGIGVLITGATAQFNVLQYNRIAVSPLATEAQNATGLQIEQGATNNFIGSNGDPSDDAGETNAITGNSVAGIVITDSGTTHNRISANVVGGTDANSANGIGILVKNGAQDNVIGTDGDNGFPSALGNYVMSNKGYGIKVTDVGTTGNRIAGNRIGFRLSTESTTYGNAGGIEIANGAQNTIIGSNQDGVGDASEGNFIGGNTGAGVHIFGAGTTNNKIVGNYIGVDWDDYFKGNGKSIYLEASNATLNTLILNNFIGGSYEEGILIKGANGNTLKGNQIGTNLAGTSALGINQGAVMLSNARDNIIGGVTSTDANIIGGGGKQIGAGCVNTIMLMLFGGGTQNNTIQGNQLGINVNGQALNCANSSGILIRDASNNLIGGTTTGTRNIIAYAFSGIDVQGVGVNNRLLGNVMYNISNGLLIDLGSNWVTPNDPGDNDTGPNNLQNTLDWSVPNHQLTGATTVTVYARLDSTPNTTFRVEFFGSNYCEYNTNRGEAKYFIGSKDITTDDTGIVSFAADLTVPQLNNRPYLIANVTGPSGTSEFTPCLTFNRAAVTNVNDSGDGSFRRAIEITNALTIPTQIDFAIPGTGVKEITLLSPLPALSAHTSNRVLVNGLSQTGATCAAPKIALKKGYVETSNGLTVTGGYDIEGLIIGGFTDGYGISVQSGSIIQCNFLGVTADGVTANSNRIGLQSQSNNAQIYDNVISGNLEQGVLLEGALSNIFKRNRIGVDVTGMLAVPNGMEGIKVGGTDIRIVEGNVISGNKGDGIYFAVSETCIVYGSIIGLNATGTAAIPNEGNGVRVQGYHISVGGATIGNYTPNVISGNLKNGVLVESNNNYVDGNVVGTDYPAKHAFGNRNNGIYVSGNENEIGVVGSSTHLNIVGGNALDGILLMGFANKVTGVTIGFDSSGAATLGNVQNGIRVISNNSLVTTSKFGGNGQAGIADYASNTTITGNTVGPNATGISLFAPIVYVDAVTEVSGNMVAQNTGNGIEIVQAGRKRVRIFNNNVYANGGLGIDLGADGITANDVGDIDSGANNLQNSPLLIGFDRVGTQTKLVGTLNSQPNASYTLRLYGNSACDPTGYGEGQFTSVASVTTLTTNASGNVNFTVTMTSLAYPYVTATVEDTAGNTSEFSNCVVPRPDTIGIYRPSTNRFYLRNANTTGFADITVNLAPLGMNPNAPVNDVPVVGDWNGDGIDTAGFYRRSTGEFILSDSNITPHADHTLVLGNPNDTPIIGDWNGDGIDGVGVFRPSNGLIYLKNQLTTGFADFTMVLGVPGDVGLAGDWNGDGKDSPGVYRPSTGMFFLSNQVCNCQVFADHYTVLGILGDQPFAGDWNGDGRTGLGVFRPTNGLTYLRNDATTSGYADFTFVFGVPNDVALAGVWENVGASITAETAPTFVPSKR